MIIKHNTGYEHIHIWRNEWAVESQKILHIFKDGSAPIKTEHGIDGLEIIQVRVKQGNTTIITIDFRECLTADVLINTNAFGNVTLRFEYIYYYESLQQPYVIDSYTEVTLTINQKTIINTNVVPKCTGQIITIDEDTTLFTPPTTNIINVINVNQTMIWGYKGINTRNFSMRINEGNSYVNLTTRNENYGQNNTKTRWFFTTISTNNALKLRQGAKLEILDADNDNNIIWSGANIQELNILSNVANVQITARYVNFSTNNNNPFIFNGIITDNINVNTADYNSKRYIVRENYNGIKEQYNDLEMVTSVSIPNLTMYDIWLYTNILSNSPQYIISFHTNNLQNNFNIYIIKEWTIIEPTEINNGIINIDFLRKWN